MNTEKYKLYTKGGDKGMTSLVGGQRVPKYDLRIESYGTIDELNSFIGHLLSFDLEEADRKTLTWMQHKLFSVGSYLATDPNDGSFHMESRVTDEAITRVEQEIDRLDGLVPPIKAFILPAGGAIPAAAHICRTVCRRAERRIYKLDAERGQVEAQVLRYVNRLSDYFFALARKESYRLNGEEITWLYEHD
ncbi:MAG: cob(I)yrinic acid a,c-diamide adenosyltransferase [Porphyromonadaceae bacterium]|nr:cob(I)yrinic acid a,c-diamide adenosyltransferase [Porphyromonadaceae bacterium]